jgi:hypothetical protein
MSKNRSRPVKSVSAEHQVRIAKARELIAAELPELVARERHLREAAEENTLSGELRRAIHRGDRDLIALGKIVGITPIQLSEFLTGERTLRSDVLDRLVAAVGAHLVAAATE